MNITWGPLAKADADPLDADNPTGALGVYSRAGFQVLRRNTAYALPL